MLYTHRPGSESRCSACEAPIIWLIHEKTKKLGPIDRDGSENGNVVMVTDTVYRVLGKEAEREAARARGQVLRVSHYVTCPDAARFGQRAAGSGARPRRAQK